jgi:hypothetical protein
MRIKFIKTLATSVIVVGLGATLTQAAAPPTPQGAITEKLFYNIGGGTTVADLTSNAKFINNTPDKISYDTYFEMYAGADINTPPPGDLHNNAGCQIVGYFYPATSGDYTFYICADDGAALYLSTDDTAANKKLIAQETAWSGARAYTSSGDGTETYTNKNSSTFGGTQWPVKDPSGMGAKITLQAGKAYYIEALEKEGGGGEDLSVSIDGVLPIDGSMLSSIDKTSGNLSIKTQPASLAVAEGSPATFTVVVDGTPPYTYQWKNAGVDITDATNVSYTIPRAYRADSGSTFSVAITGAAGPALTSTTATLTVNNDTAGPNITGTSTTATFDTVVVTFSEPVDPATGTNANNYKLTNPTTAVLSAALQAPAGSTGDNVVVLKTAKMPGTTLLTLTVNNVKDVPGNVIAANTTAGVQTFVFTTGWATYARWDGDTTSLSDFALAIGDGSKGPASVYSSLTAFDGPWGAADNYNSQKFTWFTPPSNGDYVFFVSSDDGSNLYLSTDDTAANKKLIAYESAWSNQYQWTTSGGSSDLTAKRSDTCGTTEWPTGNTITLQANKKYYMEILHHEGTGGDGAGATFIKVGDPDPSNDANGFHLQGKVIGTYLDPSGASIEFVTQPADTQVVEGQAARLTVKVNGTSVYGNTVAYQWQKAPPGSSTFTDIDGATLASYTTPLLTLTDSLSKYQVVVGVPGLNKTSAAATVTVVPDTFPPIMLGATALSGTKQVGVAFDEALDAATAGNPANYTVNGVAPTAALLRVNVANEPSNEKNLVSLTVPTAVTADFAVTATGIKDLKGNAMVAKSLTGKISKLTSTDIGSPAGQPGGPDPLFPTTVTTWGPGNYDILCNGNDFWNNADGMNFLWEPKTGSFDVKVRVVSVSPVDNWSAGGICVREGPVTANGQGWELARHYYCKIDFGGSLSGGPCIDNGTSTGANQYEFNCRLAPGDPTLRETSNNGQGGCRGNGGTLGTAPGAPTWPNAWIRMAREKTSTTDLLKCYTSTTGADADWALWYTVDLNDSTHAGFLDIAGNPAGKWPDTCYVGVCSSSHTGIGNGNATNDVSGLELPYSPLNQPFGCYVIVRDYGDVVIASAPTLSATTGADGKVTITYTGTLVSSDTANGTYAPVANATSPYVVDPKAAGAKPSSFYKAQQ